MLLIGKDWGFILGLGITQFIDALGALVAENVGIIGNIVAIVFNVMIAALFVVFGIFAKKRYNGAFIIGMILYSLDSLLSLLIGDLFGFGFHIFALFCIYGGFKAAKKLSQMELNQIPEVATTPANVLQVESIQ